ncbi:FAD/NAD(P)-binding domain-containing protein [Rickenella mellea]|uniref:FAD/NAD(P)-binding domain-containing protein n=1 Tax=Rickenella mellea TaxID=50990 RepID=A0A4Y7Q2G1_9AGAM|nr:FAD/NAD(P)-binding domain-containing protein [Rickenella mellea]
MTFIAIDPQVTLPTLDKLRAKIPADLDAHQIATQWFASFSKSIGSGDGHAVVDLFAEDDFRTIQGKPRVIAFLRDILPSELDGSDCISFQEPFTDLSWIQILFSFETPVGIGSGVIRLIPLASGDWTAHSVLTNLEDLKGFPERIGALRAHKPDHGKWLEKRQREIEFVDTEPKVVIIGAGQTGLAIAARLKCLDVPTLVVEKESRVGGRWRDRYEALCLHDPVWYDHMPYIPFPASWPTYTPAKKLADWLDFYAHSLELNIWTSSIITSLTQDASQITDANKPGKGTWTLTIKRGEGTERTFSAGHVVFAVGSGGGVPVTPNIPGMDEFPGKMLHSSEHKSARDHAGKKVIVGACTSAHDIAQDHQVHRFAYVMSAKTGIPILLGLYTEDGPQTDVADRINASFPIPLLKLMAKRLTNIIAEQDRELLEGLTKRGFKLNYGEDGSGSLILAWKRGGGFTSVHVGASQLIIDGKIKLKNDAQISRFTTDGIQFDDGSEIPADVVIFATGYGDAREPARRLIGDKLADKLLRVWGLNDEGEINSVWRWSGVSGLYFMMGNFALCRFHSKHVALPIEEGGFGNHYTKRS